ncbi:MAG: hypothetical protein AB7U97_09000 [Pirellulales bacterium]
MAKNSLTLAILLLASALVARACLANFDVPATVTGTLQVPAGEYGFLNGNISLDDAAIAVDGVLLTAGPTEVTGDGQVQLNQPAGQWGFSCCTPNSLTIGSGIQVLGQRGAQFSSNNATNWGTFTAIPGGDASQGFTINASSGFVNHGLLEAQSGGELRIDGASAWTFGTASLLRANAGGTIRISNNVNGSIRRLSDLGAVENLGGEIQLYNVALSNEGQTLTFRGGDWTLWGGNSISGGTVNTADGGRFLVKGTGNPAQLIDVTLQDDVTIFAGSKLKPVGNLTLDDANIRFDSGTTFLQLTPASTLVGSGALISQAANNSSGRIEASGGLVSLPATLKLQADAGFLSLVHPSGDTLGAFDVAGPIEAGGGTVTHTRAITTRGDVTAHTHGTIDVSAPWTNLGAMRVENGGRLNLRANLINEGSLHVENAIILHRGGSITGSGAVSISDSLVLATGTMSLENYLAVGGTRVDHGVFEGSLNLAGGAITLGAQPGERWTFSGGALSNGIVNSSDGAELVPVDTFSKARFTLQNIELNADARVPAGADLTVTGTLTGTGRVIVDGGRLVLGSFGTQQTPADVIDRITPSDGLVLLSGGLNNTGGVIRLRAGVDWAISHVRNNGIVGGRIEGDPGVPLVIQSGYGSAGYATFRENVTLALPLIIQSSSANAAYVREGLTFDGGTVTIGTQTTLELNNARLVFQGPQALAGNGEIRFGPASGNPGNPATPRVNMIQADSSLAIAAGILIRSGQGDGYVGGAYQYQQAPLPISIDNQGTFLAENGHTLTLFVRDFQQRGTLRAEAGSRLVVDFQPTLPDAEFINRGRIEAAGGNLSFVGGLVLSDSSTLSFNLVASNVASNAAIDISGAAELGGLLKVVLPSGYSPLAGDSFRLLTTTEGVSGAFAYRALPRLADGLYWSLALDANNLDLNVLSGAPDGDYNSDGTVDAADFVAWRDSNGTPEEYETWREHFGQSAPGAAATSASVPEPTALSLLALLSLATLRRR